VLSVCFLPSGIAQTKEAAKQQAESQLKQMTPQQIEAKIKEYGMTREQAESKAKELGIDLSTYLQQQGGAAEPQQEKPPAEDLTSTQESATGEQKQEIKKPAPATGRGGLPYFGYDIFAATPAAFEPTAVGPVDPEYVVGPGDVLRVSVWGQVEMQSELTVDKEGRIFIPTVGPVLLSGFTLESAFNKLKLQMSKSYSGLVSRPPSVWMDLTIARMRPKRVYIMGEVGSPGGYTVSSYSTVFSTLFSVGGPTVRGTLRDIRVIRGNKTIAHIDLYDYLLGADSTNDIRVQNNDIIYVPVRGKTVAIIREVRRPALYELLPKENLQRLLEFSGGALRTAYLERIQVDRVIPFAERKPGELERRIIDVNFREVLNAGKDYTLVDGDAVTVYSIFDDRQNTVNIGGAVIRPGQYQLEKAQTIRSLIAAADGLDPKAYLEVAHLIRFNDDWTTRRIIPFNLHAVLTGEDPDWSLNTRDELVIFSTDVFTIRNRSVTIRGEVKTPGKYPLSHNMTLDDLILIAGGYTESAELLQAEVSRVVPGGIPGDSLVAILHPKLPLSFTASGKNIGRDTVSAQSLEALGYFLLQHLDEVVVRQNPEYTLQQNVEVQGDVKYPGVYTLERKGERLSNILHRAGGLTSTSYLGGAQFYRGGQRLLLDFSQAFDDMNPKHDVVMFPGDRIVVPTKPHTVLVGGEVNTPALLSYIEGDAVSDYIDRAGGRTENASYAIVTKPTGESQRVNFGFLRSNPTVPEGSLITVTRIPPSPPEEKGPALADTIKDIFAIATSAATIAFIVWQTTK
jgi:polysaccharide export outer membrane protein